MSRDILYRISNTATIMALELVFISALVSEIINASFILVQISIVGAALASAIGATAKLLANRTREIIAETEGSISSCDPQYGKGVEQKSKM